MEYYGKNKAIKQKSSYIIRILNQLNLWLDI